MEVGTCHQVIRSEGGVGRWGGSCGQSSTLGDAKNAKKKKDAEKD